MIKNILQANEFEITGVDCICQSINGLFQISETAADFIRDKGDITGITMKEIWEHHNVAINTAFVLLHQGLEALLKARICNVSPLLLLETKRGDWPTLPQSGDIEFSEMHQVGGANLIVSFFATEPTGDLSSLDFHTLIEDIRKIRNEIVHVRPRGDINVENAVKYSLKVFTAFYGKDKWLEFLRSRFIANPMYIHDEVGIPYFWKTVNFVWGIIGKTECRRHLTIERQTRFYYCPSCSYDLIPLGEPEEIKLSYLTPNEPDSTTLYCLVCDKPHQVKREKCNKGSCPGNVLSVSGFTSICMTCFGEQI